MLKPMCIAKCLRARALLSCHVNDTSRGMALENPELKASQRMVSALDQVCDEVFALLIIELDSSGDKLITPSEVIIETAKVGECQRAVARWRVKRRTVSPCPSGPEIGRLRTKSL